MAHYLAHCAWGMWMMDPLLDIPLASGPNAPALSRERIPDSDSEPDLERDWGLPIHQFSTLAASFNAAFIPSSTPQPAAASGGPSTPVQARTAPAQRSSGRRTTGATVLVSPFSFYSSIFSLNEGFQSSQASKGGPLSRSGGQRPEPAATVSPGSLVLVPKLILVSFVQTNDPLSLFGEPVLLVDNPPVNFLTTFGGLDEDFARSLQFDGDVNASMDVDQPAASTSALPPVASSSRRPAPTTPTPTRDQRSPLGRSRDVEDSSSHRRTSGGHRGTTKSKGKGKAKAKSSDPEDALGDSEAKEGETEADKRKRPVKPTHLWDEGLGLLKLVRNALGKRVVREDPSLPSYYRVRTIPETTKQAPYILGGVQQLPVTPVPVFTPSERSVFHGKLALDVTPAFPSIRAMRACVQCSSRSQEQANSCTVIAGEHACNNCRTKGTKCEFAWSITDRSRMLDDVAASVEGSTYTLRRQLVALDRSARHIETTGNILHLHYRQFDESSFELVRNLRQILAMEGHHARRRLFGDFDEDTLNALMDYLAVPFAPLAENEEFVDHARIQTLIDVVIELNTLVAEHALQENMAASSDEFALIPALPATQVPTSVFGSPSERVLRYDTRHREDRPPPTPPSHLRRRESTPLVTSPSPRPPVASSSTRPYRPRVSSPIEVIDVSDDGGDEDDDIPQPSPSKKRKANPSSRRR